MTDDILKDKVLRHFMEQHELFRVVIPQTCQYGKSIGHQYLDEFHFLPAIFDRLPAEVTQQAWLFLVNAQYRNVLPRLVRVDEPIDSQEGVSPMTYKMLYSSTSESLLFRESSIHPVRLLLYFLSRPHTVTYHVIREIAGAPRQLIQFAIPHFDRATSQSQTLYYQKLHDLLKGCW